MIQLISFWVSEQIQAASLYFQSSNSHDGVSQQTEAMNVLISSAQLVHKFDEIKYQVEMRDENVFSGYSEGKLDK